MSSSPYLHFLARLTPGLPPWEAATEFLPWLFRWISFLLVLPVLVLLAADFLTYLYFRIVYQPFGHARTAFYKMPDRWRSRSPSATPSPPRKTSPLPPVKTDTSPKIGLARAMDVGMEGPLLDPQSPGAEDVPLPMVDEEENDFFVDR